MATIFLLPGLLCDATVWAAQERALSRTHDVHIANFYGHDSLVTMAQSVLDVAPDSFMLAGHSMGGRVALEICRLAKNRVTRVALLDTGIHGTEDDERPKRMALVELARSQGMEAMARRWLWPMVHPKRTQDMALMNPLVEMICRATPDIFFGQQTALLNRADATDIFTSLTCPVLIACGRQDLWSTFAQHEAMAALLPHAEFSAIEDSGHMVMNEQPDSVSRLLVDFFA